MKYFNLAAGFLCVAVAALDILSGLYVWAIFCGLTGYWNLHLALRDE